MLLGSFHRPFTHCLLGIVRIVHVLLVCKAGLYGSRSSLPNDGPSPAMAEERHHEVADNQPRLDLNFSMLAREGDSFQTNIRFCFM